MRTMKILFPVILSLIAFSSVDAQKKTINGKKIKEIKEWKIDSGKRTLSELSKYDANGERIEQIKYETNGSQKERTVFEYNANGKCITETKYDEFNKLEKKTVIEYNSFGKRSKETSYDAKGKVKSVKEVEYITE